MLADRLSGTFFLLFGLAMYFLVIPGYTESPEGGNLSPKAVPNYISVVIAVCGGFLALKPTQHATPNLRAFLTVGLYSVVLAVGIIAMSYLGFEIVAPVLSFAIMWLIGERRPLWLVGGVILMPLAIWFLVTYPLGRALP
jgi:putative tricarboxylic transport membrane protein